MGGINRLKLKILLLLLLLCFILQITKCSLFELDNTSPDPDPFTAITGKEDIIGEWVCYHTFLQWRHGRKKFYLDKELEEDVIKIDSNRVHWKFLKDGLYYEYDFPYIMDENTFFRKDSAFVFPVYPIHHWGEPFGDLHSWTEVMHNSKAISFTYHPDPYTWEDSYYTRKTH